uniref:Uncharacterized protein n=1 Tax=Malurus cyaneus samueli TaxID=2593467 RepID=A0A8C5TQL3_9PASS
MRAPCFSRRPSRSPAGAVAPPVPSVAAGGAGAPRRALLRGGAARAGPAPPGVAPRPGTGRRRRHLAAPAKRRGSAARPRSLAASRVVWRACPSGGESRRAGRWGAGRSPGALSGRAAVCPRRGGRRAAGGTWLPRATRVREMSM